MSALRLPSRLVWRTTRAFSSARPNCHASVPLSNPDAPPDARRNVFEHRYADKLKKRVEATEEPGAAQRKDNSPVKPLSDLLDLGLILRKPHTPTQISALWNVYHASRTNGTGRGFLSAAIPVDVYDSLRHRAKMYPMFVLPLARKHPALEQEEHANTGAHEFFLMEWAFHGSPDPPSPSQDPLDILASPPSAATSHSPSSPPPPTSTILFTPLGEYKLRQSYAQPHLIITHYTELAHTHGTVLMRGEIVPSSNNPSSFMLSQIDAHLLALGVQRFYLPSKPQGEDEAQDARLELVRVFHEEPAKFKWEELIEAADVGLGEK
ncbi:hypothetical protein BOTBODRAFT_574740 [Botryobasidium botryosum FD-172 SS1]|uniref:ATP11-domain-containing protein n=1 Tax=Botryobasidium botryosum (strain FD-172 SS1) TaxID=930990 RepID=A0A067N111_BOTB1|nr:hypothetical protein BOTBODRAFT_574740 [Botryobasidium botryosum FD-172 SS1]